MNREHIVSLLDPLNESSKRVAERLGESVEGETAAANGRIPPLLDKQATQN